MLTQEDVVEIHALKRRGWSNAVIARHTGRDRKTIRRHLRGWKPTRGTEPSVLEPYRPYLEARFADDPHVFATVLARELEGLGFRRSYPTLVRELRRLALRPACSCCRAGTQLTVAIAHEPGEELQLDWLELHETPWARKAYVLVGVLSHSGRIRGVFSEGMSFAHARQGHEPVSPFRRNPGAGGPTGPAWPAPTDLDSLVAEPPQPQPYFGLSGLPFRREIAPARSTARAPLQQLARRAPASRCAQRSSNPTVLCV